MFFYLFRLSAHRLHSMLFFQSCLKTPYVFCGTEDLRKIPRIYRTQSNEISLSISTLGFSFVKIQSVIVMLTHITKARNWSSQRVKKMLMDFAGIISDNFVVLHSFSLRTWRSHYSFLIFNRCFEAQKFNLKSDPELCGVTWSSLLLLFSIVQRHSIHHNQSASMETWEENKKCLHILSSNTLGWLCFDKAAKKGGGKNNESNQGPEKYRDSFVRKIETELLGDTSLRSARREIKDEENRLFFLPLPHSYAQ